MHQAQGNYQAAEQDLRLALKRNFELGTGAGEPGRFVPCLAGTLRQGDCCSKRLPCQPHAAQVRVATALWHVRQGRACRSAQSLLAEGHRVGPQAGSGHVYAVALNSAGQADKAIQVIDELIEADTYSDQVVQLGIVCAQQHALPSAWRYRSLLGFQL